jgi:chemotaxis protein MotA
VDIATILGIIIGWGALFGSVLLEGGELGAFVNIPAFIVILGGTLGATTVAFPLKSILSLPQFILQTIKPGGADPQALIDQLVELAQKARSEGLLALDEEVQNMKDPLLQKGMQLIVDGAEPDTIRDVLEAEVDMAEHEDRVGEKVLFAMGGFSPTLGVIGTVMGLIHALGKMSTPQSMGSAIGSAFIATFYGVALANLVWLPMGSKLRARADHQRQLRDMVIEGLLSIQAGDNPRLLSEKLHSFVPAGERPAVKLEKAA